VLLAGDGAALSHQTAAELFKITDQPSSLIHLTIPHTRRMSPAAGLVIHRSSRLGERIHPVMVPPRTRVEDTVLDLVEQATVFDKAFSTVCAATQRRLTTGDRIGQAMSRRKKMRWRAELAEALGLIATGVHSVLEYRYVRKVELPHGLPSATRQAKVTTDGQSRYLDNLYGGFAVCVELDGQEAHPDDHRWSDLRRVNTLTELGLTVLRYGWTDVERRPCATAAQIATVLRNRGWPGPARRCSPACAVSP
jgi:hypothetical protein